MRFVIAGAGSIGSVLGGYLALKGYSVVLVARPPHARVIREKGLTLKTAQGELHPVLDAIDDFSGIDWTDRDIIFVTSKSQDTQDLLSQLRDAPAGTPVFCFQNGVRNEEWASKRFEQVYAGLVVFSVTYVEAGVVEHTRNDVLAIGCFPVGLDQRSKIVSEALTNAGFRVTLDEDVMASKWGKMLVNLNNALYALIDTWLQLAYTDEQLRHFLAETMREGLMVTKALGIQSRMGPGEPPVSLFIETLDTGGYGYPDALELPSERRTYPSTWQDIVLGRPNTEVEHFNGEIVRLGIEAGISTPYNSTLLEMMGELTNQGAMPGLFRLQDVQDRVQKKNDG